MKRLTTYATLLMLALAPAAVSAGESATNSNEVQAEVDDANHGKGKHKHKKKYKSHKKHKTVVVHGKRRSHRGPRVVVRPVVRHRRHVVVHSGPAVVNTVHHVPARRRAVTHRQYVRRPVEDRLLGIGVRLSGVTVDGDKLNLGAVENPTMGGLGLQIRGKVSKNVGLELATDVLYGQTEYMDQTTVPITLSAMYYFIPRGKFKLYGLLGGGVHLTKLEYHSGFRHDLVEIAGQAGAGMELRFSQDFGLSADLRFIGLYKNIESESSIESKCMGLSGSTINCGGIKQTEKFNAGAQFMVGANMYF
jgi:hypothetical protein